MYNRYKNNNILYTQSNKRYLSTTNTYSIKPEIDDVYVISKRGDRLDLLANQYYNDVTLWTLIARANHLSGGSIFIEPGIRLRIPNNPSMIQTQDRN